MEGMGEMKEAMGEKWRRDGSTGRNGKGMEETNEVSGLGNSPCCLL